MNGFNKPRESGVFSNGQHFANDRSSGQNQSSFDHVTCTDIDWDGFSGQRGFVQRPLAFQYSAIGRDQLTASNLYAVTGAYQIHRDGFGFDGFCHGKDWSSFHDVFTGGSTSGERHGGLGIHGERLDDLPCSSWKSVKSSLHGLSGLDQGIGFQVSGERNKNGHDEGFLPHLEDASPNDRQTGEDLEPDLTGFE